MAYTDLLPDVLAQCPGLDDGFALRTLRRVGVEFCVKTLLWEQDIDLDIVESQEEYTLTPVGDPAGDPPVPAAIDAVVQEIVSVKYKTDEDQEFEDLSSIDESRYELVGDDTLKFTHSDYAPTEEIEDGLRVRVVVRPELDSDDLPEYFFERYGEALIAGAVARLMLSPVKPYSNPSLSGHYQNLYNRGVVRAMIEKRKLGRHSLEDFSA